MKYNLYSRWTLLILVIFVINLWSSFLPVAQQKQPLFVVVIDAGHGGNDVGKECSNPKIYKHEKDIVLPIALQLGEYLENKLKNVKVVYTRTEDRYVSLEERVKIANATSADLFVSLHCNSHPNRAIYGAQVHVHTHDLKFSKLFAQKLMAQLSERAKRKVLKLQTASSRGHNLFVLQNTRMPAVLVELGFLSHPEEEKYLNSEYGKVILASAVFRAVREYREVIQ